MSNYKSLISVIMPAYNAEVYIVEAIESILNQTWSNWELLIVNDGSMDCTEEAIKPFLSDNRIKYFKHENKGVSAARNVGLKNIKGNYFCFLDADDVLPPNSLAARLSVFKTNLQIKFVDGVVEKKDHSLKQVVQLFTPTFPLANPLSDLIRLTGRSFFGLSWMFKREPEQHYLFQSELTHSEDLLFYMQSAREGGLYGYTSEVIYQYRNNPSSAMSNLEGLEKGYWQVYKTIKHWKEVKRTDLWVYKMKVKKIMYLSYLKKGAISKAIKAVVKTG